MLCALALVAALASGCRTLAPRKKPVEPFAASQGALFGSVVMRGHEFPNVIPHGVEEMFFAQVLPSGELDLDHPIATNYLEGGQVYLLNIPPGRYVPLTASYYHRRVRYQGKLPPDEGKLWAVDVGPGQVAYLGADTLRTEWQGFGHAIMDWLKQLVAHLPPFPRLTTSIEVSTPRVDRAPETEAHALRRAREALKGSLWVAAIDQRLTVLGNPPEPVLQGLVFKTKKARVGQGAFKYIETLGWGQPKAAPGGLRWSEPKGRAEVLVAYMQPDVPGYKPRDRYLDDMRAAGSPEDTHVLTEIMISSRPAQVATYTTYLYGEAALPGSEVRVFKTETLLVPAADGYYILRYRALRASFDAFYQPFRRFAQYVEYEAPMTKPRVFE